LQKLAKSAPLSGGPLSVFIPFGDQNIEMRLSSFGITDFAVSESKGSTNGYLEYSSRTTMMYDPYCI
jgi:hypothetical protein